MNKKGSKMNKIIYPLIFLIIYFPPTFAGDFSVYEANYPNVKDYNINVDEATLVVHSRGNFIEMNLYMTVSYDFESWFFKNYNELDYYIIMKRNKVTSTLI